MDGVMFNYNDAIAYIGARCEVDITDIETVLMLELEYMKTLGLVVEVE